MSFFLLLITKEDILQNVEGSWR